MIEVELTYDDSDYQRAIKFMSRSQYIVFGGLLALGGISLVGFWYEAGLADSESWTVPVILGLIIFAYALVVLMQRWNIARQLRKIPDAYGPYTWMIDTEGIRIIGALSNTALKWAAITKVRESRTDFFFYQAPRFARFLPKRILTSQALADLRGLINECMPDKAKLLKE